MLDGRWKDHLSRKEVPFIPDSLRNLGCTINKQVNFLPLAKTTNLRIMGANPAPTPVNMLTQFDTHMRNPDKGVAHHVLRLRPGS